MFRNLGEHIECVGIRYLKFRKLYSRATYAHFIIHLRQIDLDTRSQWLLWHQVVNSHWLSDLSGRSSSLRPSVSIKTFSNSHLVFEKLQKVLLRYAISHHGRQSDWFGIRKSGSVDIGVHIDRTKAILFIQPILRCDGTGLKCTSGSHWIQLVNNPFHQQACSPLPLPRRVRGQIREICAHVRRA